MRRLRSKFISLALGVAVLLVCATCTSAGCLLKSTISPASASAPLKPCCARRHANDNGKTPANHRCPLCQHTVLLCKSIDQAQYDFSLAALSPVLCSAPAVDCLGLPDQRFANLPEGAPPGGSTTLVDLHCALLN